MDAAEHEAVGRWRPDPSWRRRVMTPVIVGLCRVLIERLNHLEMVNREAFDAARATGRPLLTFSNHVSLFDDPWLVGTFAGSRWEDTRWCATDAMNFFSNPVTARFFSFGRGVPIVRGAGLDQPGMTFLLERLKMPGEWVHIFPEGGRSRDPLHLRTPLKNGIGHLAARTMPLLLPFHHSGMEEVLPIGARIPRVGKQIRLVFGEAVETATQFAGVPAEQLPDAITAWAEAQLLALEELARPAEDQSAVSRTRAAAQTVGT
jgi:monolysocardiolipin acyltransferase